MAAPQIGIGTSHIAGTIGTKYITVDPTGVTGFSNAATFVIGISPNRPIILEMQNVLSRLGIFPGSTAWAAATNNKALIKVRADPARTGSYYDLPDLGKCW